MGAIKASRKNSNVTTAAATVRRERRNFASDTGIDIRGADAIALHIVNVLRAVAGDDDPDAPFDYLAGRVRIEVQHGDAIRCSVDHLLAIGRVAILVEVEAGGVGFVGEANDTVAGVGIDPGFGRRVGGEG